MTRIFQRAAFIVVLSHVEPACHRTATLPDQRSTDAVAAPSQRPIADRSAPLPEADSPAASPPPPTPSQLDWNPPQEPTTSWCKEGFVSLSEGMCVLVPPQLREPKSLLVYLHGVIAPYGDSQRIVQGIVARNARSRGYVALMPRGRRGLGPPPTEDWWAWPTTSQKHRQHAPDMIRSWNVARNSLQEKLGIKFDRTYLAGSSNGAFFATIVALNGEFDADGYGAMSGGSAAGRSKAQIRATKRGPFYVGYGVYDELKPHPISLGQLLQAAGWPNRVAEHREGHGAREIYLDEAFTFWGGP